MRAPAPVDRLVARVCKAKNSLFDGEGARRVGGRWNHPGTAVVYTADHAALAVLEVLAHLDQVPTDYVLIMATVPADVIETIDELNLPGGWNSGTALDFTKDFGTRWAAELRSAVLSVPSVAVPGARNYIINPAHPDFRKIAIQGPVPLQFDQRLWKKSSAITVRSRPMPRRHSGTGSETPPPPRPRA